jgi:3-oxoacyl-[acyl-carrier-protein] synthase-1
VTSARPFAIESVGAFTSAGVRAATAFGSARLNLKFFEELPWRDAGGEPAIGARTPLDLAEIAGAERLATMASLALRECAGGPRSGGEPPAPLFLCLPDPDPDVQPGESAAAAAGVLAAVGAQAGAAIDAGASRAFATGRAAIFDALDAAAALLVDRSYPVVYVGGVDSLVEREAFDRWLRAGRLKTSTTEGAVAGEGAAFLRLTRGDGSAGGALATVAGVARASEPRLRGAAEPNIGQGLSEAARTALAAASLPVAEIGAFIHDAAGDRFGFREASLAIARLRPRADPPPLVATTAACAGELGAAYGPFALGMAAFFLHRNVTDGEASLVLGTSEGAARGAAVVTRARAPRGRR